MSSIAVGYGSASFEFKSRYPDLHMPAYPISDPNYVAPGHADALLDGEWLILDANRELARPAGNAAGLTDLEENHAAHICHGNPGRSDHQVGQHLPWVMDDDFEIVTRLHAGNKTAGAAAPSVGDYMMLAIDDITLPFGTGGTTAFVGKVILRGAGPGEPYVARCTEAPDTRGWARFFCHKGTRQ